MTLSAASGIREMMAKGPEWAKSNLTKERMEQVRRYLSLEEDVRFRCPLGKARPELEAAESEAGATTPHANPDEARRQRGKAPAAQHRRQQDDAQIETIAPRQDCRRPRERREPVRQAGVRARVPPKPTVESASEEPAINSADSPIVGSPRLPVHI